MHSTHSDLLDHVSGPGQRREFGFLPMMRFPVVSSVALALAVALAPGSATGQPLDVLIERLDRLEEENQQLRREVEQLKAILSVGEAMPDSAAGKADQAAVSGNVHVEATLGYQILDPTTDINRKQHFILEQKREGVLAPGSAYLHGAVTAVVNSQTSNRADKFGYLMRQPNPPNQIGTKVSEAAIHSMQLGTTFVLDDWVTGHAMMLFDPGQSFGAGTNTDLERNQVQVRQAYALFGNLDRSPVFASLGKMAVPFGLTDTVNPFTASTVWHAFGGLANGAAAGYADEGLNLTVMAIQGGSQHRAANVPVGGTNTPSRLNNFAMDANYTLPVGSETQLLFGGSYLHGSAYCQDYPVQHFEPCRDNNPAFDVYGRLVSGGLALKAEFARTFNEWPGTFNPGIPEFTANDVTAFDAGARYRFDTANGPVDISAEFSRFIAGPDGAPWEKQDQFVLGAALFSGPGTKIFAEYVHVDGFVPLNFLSGGSVRDANGNVQHDRTISDASASSDVFLFGVNAAF